MDGIVSSEIISKLLDKSIAFLDTQARKKRLNEEIRSGVERILHSCCEESFFNELSKMIENRKLLEKINNVTKRIPADFVSKEQWVHGVLDQVDLGIADKSRLEGVVVNLFDVFHEANNRVDDSQLQALANHQRLEMGRFLCDLARNDPKMPSASEKRNAYIKNEYLQLRVRCIQRLVSLGVECEIAENIVDRDCTEADYDYLIEGFTEKTRIWIGDFGVGKSHALMICALRLLARATENPEIRLPLFKEVSSITNLPDEIAPFVEQYGDAMVFLDGLDEYPHGKASALLQDIAIIKARHPNMSFIVTSRDMTQLHDRSDLMLSKLKPMDEGHRDRLLSEISGSSIDSLARVRMNDNMKEAISRPFFSIILGLRIRNEGIHATQRVASVIDLFASNMRNRTSFLECEDDLYKLGRASIDANYGAVDVSMIGRKCDLDAMLRTGLVYANGQQVGIALPLIAQYLGAKAIEKNIISIEDLLDNEAYLRQWRYALSLYLGYISYEEGFDVFRQVAEKYPQSAAIVLNEGVQLSLGSQILPPANKAGEYLYACMKTWIDSLGSIGQSAWSVNGERLNSIFVDVQETNLSYGWAVKEERPRITVCPPQEMLMHCASMHGLCPTGGSLWPWKVTFDDIYDRMDDFLEKKKVIYHCKALVPEMLWDTALKMEGFGPFHDQPIHVSKFAELPCLLKERYDSFSYGKTVFSRFELECFSREVDKLARKGVHFVEAPYPWMDIETDSSVIRDHFSDERIWERMCAIWTTAFQAYYEITNAWESGLTSAMPLNAFSPISMSIGISATADTSVYSMGFESLSSNNESRIEFYKYDRRSEQKGVDSMQKAKQSVERYHPNEWEYLGIYSSTALFDFWNVTPATNLVCDMLKKNLESAGWQK